MFGHSSTADAKNNPGFMTVGNRESKARRIDAILQDYSGSKIEGKDILDVGCGSEAIADYFAAKNQVTGIDVIDQRSDEFKSDRFIFLTYRDSQLPVPANSFDIVISNHVLAYIPDKESHLAELARVLRPGGLLYVATPNRFFPLEPHFKMPFVHYLPAPLFNALMRKLGIFREPVFLTHGLQLKRLLNKSSLKTKDITAQIIKHGSKYGMVSRDRPWLPSCVALLSPTLIMLSVKKKK